MMDPIRAAFLATIVGLATGWCTGQFFNAEARWELVAFQVAFVLTLAGCGIFPNAIRFIKRTRLGRQS